MEVFWQMTLDSLTRREFFKVAAFAVLPFVSSTSFRDGSENDFKKFRRKMFGVPFLKKGDVQSLSLWLYEREGRSRYSGVLYSVLSFLNEDTKQAYERFSSIERYDHDHQLVVGTLVLNAAVDDYLFVRDIRQFLRSDGIFNWQKHFDRLDSAVDYVKRSPLRYTEDVLSQLRVSGDALVSLFLSTMYVPGRKPSKAVDVLREKVIDDALEALEVVKGFQGDLSQKDYGRVYHDYRRFKKVMSGLFGDLLDLQRLALDNASFAVGQGRQFKQIRYKDSGGWQSVYTADFIADEWGVDGEKFYSRADMIRSKVNSLK